MFITQEQYDRWIKNMSKNKTGTSWVYITINPDFPNTKCKLFKDDEKNLYWVRGNNERMYLTIKEEEPICEKCKKDDCGAGAYGGLCVYVKYPNRCHKIDGEWKQYMGTGHFCEPEIKLTPTD